MYAPDCSQNEHVQILQLLLDSLIQLDFLVLPLLPALLRTQTLSQKQMCIRDRITNDVDTLSQSLNQSATQVITSVATIIGVLVMMLSISPLMTVIAILILPLSMGLIGMIVKRSQRYFKEQQEYLGYVNRCV